MFTATAQDSVRVMTEEQFLSVVRANHPLAKQAALFVEQARAELLSVRGNFDPFFTFDNERKTFDGKNYFNYTNGELVIPTWLGIEAYAGIENNFGDYINTEKTTGRTSYAGLSVPLMKDLVVDKRRTALKQAQLYTRQSVAEQRNAVNDLLLSAYQAYWNWAKDYQVFLILENTIRLNEFRYELVKVSFQNGDRAGIDTTEALAQLQNFLQQREEAWLKYRKSSLELSTYLWRNDNKPVYLTDRVIPDTAWSTQNFRQYNVQALTDWLTRTLANHPKLQVIDYKLQSLEAERRLKFQSLLPKVDLKYNFLQKGYGVAEGVNLNFFENNYKFGLNIAVPIPNRSGIGQYRSAKIKLQVTDLDRYFTQNTIENKVRFHYNEVLNLQKQISIYEQAVQNYQKLFEAEQLKFSLGETTLFLLNTRENKVLEASQKLLELKAKFYQALAALSWAGGELR